MTPEILRAFFLATGVFVLTAGVDPRLALADDASRISYLELEIQRLSSRVDEQQRRILRLEEELNRRNGSESVATMPPGRGPDIAADNPPATEPLPWHAAKSWARVAKGLSETEVTEILGPPTSVEAVGSFKTLFYRGPVAGVGSVSGIVNLKDDRVVAINAPVL
jgi:hypothetical protein